jgi:phage tail sheath protein FI
MPEYLAPGVYVEDVSYRSKSIEGVSTTTTGFLGPARFGPTEGEPELLTSLGEFERIYGDGRQLEFTGDGPSHNYLWHAARTFFEQGGKRLYVQRVLGELGAGEDGRATRTIGDDGAGAAIAVRARFPGIAGNRRVRLTVAVGQNLLSDGVGGPRVAGLRPRDLVCVGPAFVAPNGGEGAAGDFYVAERLPDGGWEFVAPGGNVALDELAPDADQVRLVTATLTVLPVEPGGLEQVWADLPLDPRHETGGGRDSIFDRFAERPANRAAARGLPLTVEGDGLADGVAALAALFREADALGEDGALREAVLKFTADDAATQLGSSDQARSFEFDLEGGSDGARPTQAAYAGAERDVDVGGDAVTVKSGLRSFEDLEDISIVAAPGSTFGYENGRQDDAAAIVQHLIGHAERMRYRVAVLDSGEAQTVGAVRAMGATLDSRRAALYYPWVRVVDPITNAEIALPPSGFVAGIYARNDIQRGVWKSPANEVVYGALGFATRLSKGQQEVLNPEGINCLRFLEGRGNRVWGARTLSSDPEYTYVSIARYLAYLSRSIDLATQWCVFESNGDRLWASVRGAVADFLLNEWNMGALLGEKPERAYFVKCDRTTMSQSDLDNGRLVCEIGVAVVKPAEFVIFRIGQWTADSEASP